MDLLCGSFRPPLGPRNAFERPGIDQLSIEGRSEYAGAAYGVYEYDEEGWGCEVAWYVYLYFPSPEQVD
jgi:hypothetical protein